MRCPTTSASGRPGRWFFKVRAGGSVRNKACYVVRRQPRGGARRAGGLVPELLGRQVSQDDQTRGHFPTEEAARKLIYLLDHLRSGETGDEPTTGAPHSFPSRSTSETDCPDPHPGLSREAGRGGLYGWQS